MDAVEVSPEARAFAELRRSLCGSDLSVVDIFSGGERVTQLAAAPYSGVEVQRVAIAGSLTTDFVTRAIACGLVQENVLPVIYQAPFGAYVQEIMDPSSGLHKFAPDVVVLAPDWRELIGDLPVDAAPEAVAEALNEQAELFQHLWSVLGQNGARVLQHTLVPPIARYRGVADRLTKSATYNQVVALNELLVEAGRGKVGWVEIDRLAEQVGIANWADERCYFASKLPFDTRYLADYIPWFRAAWRSVSARAKKVLVVDLDNTLWGGVIGDDGVEGIALGASHGPNGEAFEAWQQYVKDLGKRGVILAACSKNDPEIAASAFTHSNSRLKHEDFAAFECSWNDKLSGLRSIAQSLNVGIDSLVFVDDNPAEIALVHEQLPEIEAICLGDDPMEFRSRLDYGHWFDLSAYTAEDAGRSEAYLARRLAEDAKKTSADMGSYLRGLKMVGETFRPQPADMTRIAQMELKTNQFNVTTRRYSPDDLAGFIGRDDAVVLAFRLKDRFGDHGLTSTLIAVQTGDRLVIDSWLMSCRIFSRSAEQAMMRKLIDLAAERGVATIEAEYLRTERNGVVADLFSKLGFDRSDDKGRRWQRAVARSSDDLTTYIAEG